MMSSKFHLTAGIHLFVYVPRFLIFFATISFVSEGSVQKKSTKSQPAEWWVSEDGLFNLDDEGRAEKQQCAVAASNILRNFSFMPENEVIMGQNRHCLETIFQCIEDHVTGEYLTKIPLCPFGNKSGDHTTDIDYLS